jgi:ferritin
MHLQQLARLFFAQGDEEQEHAQARREDLVDTGGRVGVGDGSDRADHGAEDLAAGESDYLTQGFLRWFVGEQREEVTAMERLLAVVRMSGEKHLLSVEAYLAHGHSCHHHVRNG